MNTHVVVSIVNYSLGRVISCSTFDEAVKVAMEIVERSSMYSTLDGLEERLRFNCEHHFCDAPITFSIFIGMIE